MLLFSAKVNQFLILGGKVIFLIRSINGAFIKMLKMRTKMVH